MKNGLLISEQLGDVKYDIRGQLANHAHDLEKRGYEVISLNIGNPGLFGFRTPETMRLAMIENLSQAEPYSHQKGIFPAREAVVMQQQDRGVHGISAEEVFIGNGVSELITPYTDHFRITTLPDNDTLNVVFDRIESLLEQHA